MFNLGNENDLRIELIGSNVAKMYKVVIIIIKSIINSFRKNSLYFLKDKTCK